MKKTYTAPKMEIVKINMVRMIAASDLKVYSSTLDASQAESRRDSWFDDDEEEDDW